MVSAVEFEEYTAGFNVECSLVRDQTRYFPEYQAIYLGLALGTSHGSCL